MMYIILGLKFKFNDYTQKQSQGLTSNQLI